MVVLADRYDLGEWLGSGGMARVVAAYDRVLHRQVAIKLIHDAFANDPASRKRIMQEARVTAGLHHPNTVGVFDVAETDGVPFIVMELVPGRTLADRLQAEGRLSVEDTLVIADGALAGLHAAHRRGLVHRDVKPSNVLLPDEGGVKLADFGIAKVLTETAGGLTGTDQILGTPRYLAPEQTLGQPATPVSDLYSLGVVLFQCLAGELPFKASTPIAEALAHQREPVPHLAHLAPHVPVQVAGVIEQVMAKDPAGRFTDATAMRRALRSAAAAAGLPGSPDATMPIDANAPAYPPAYAEPPHPPPHAAAPGHSHGTDSGNATRVLAAPSLSADAGGSADAPRRRADSRRGRDRGPVGLWLLAGTAAAVVVLVVAIVLIAGSDEQPDVESTVNQPLAEESPEPSSTPSARPTQEPEQPSSLRELIALLDRDPGAAGEKTQDLINELRKLGEHRQPAKFAEEARNLAEKVGSWVVAGELDAGTAQLTVALLTSEAQPRDSSLSEAHDLYASVASDPVAWGDKADNLLSGLNEVLKQENPRKRADKAEDLAEKLDEWIDDDEIDESRGERALAVIERLADGRFSDDDDDDD